MKRFIQELLVSSLSSAIGFWLIAEFHWIISDPCVEHVFTGVLIGLPLGSILSLYILEKVFFKEKKVFTFLRLLGGIAFSFFIGILGILSLDFSKYPIFVLPVFVSVGFIMFRKRKNKLPKQSTTTTSMG